MKKLSSADRFYIFPPLDFGHCLLSLHFTLCLLNLILDKWFCKRVTLMFSERLERWLNGITMPLSRIFVTSKSRKDNFKSCEAKLSYRNSGSKVINRVSNTCIQTRTSYSEWYDSKNRGYKSTFSAKYYLRIKL